jgi:probable biosynthetic protein (TIGR04098 family)
MLDGEVFLLPISHVANGAPPFGSIEEAVASGVPAVRLSNIFVRQFGGPEWLRKSRPAHREFERISQLTVAPDCYMTVKQAERDGSFGPAGHEYTPMTPGPVSLDYSLAPDRDLNGAGLVYFANYPLFLDICERAFFRKADLSLPEHLINHRTILRRKSAYLHNASAHDTLEVQIEAWIQNPLLAGSPSAEQSPIRLIVNHRMLRKSDGRVMMVSTAEKIIYGHAMAELPFFEAITQTRAAARPA